jgi:hypothetical protein
MEREALKLALEALDDPAIFNGVNNAKFFIGQALAQPAQEPPSEWAGIKAILDEYGLQAIDFVVDFKAALAQPAQEPVAITVQQAHDIGAKGAEPTEAERLLFEAWMRGHCWALSATWTDGHYRSDAEQGGNFDPHAMRTRGLWAAWRDRAALGNVATPPLPVQEQVALNRFGIQKLLEQSGYDNATPEESAAFISGIRHREAEMPARELTLQEHLEKAHTDWHKTHEDWAKACDVLSKLQTPWFTINADWDKANANLNKSYFEKEKAFAEVQRIKQLIKE